MTDLIERLKQSEGPDRELDAEICAYLRRGIFPSVYDHITCVPREFVFDGRQDWYITLSVIDLPSAKEARDLAVAVPACTASLDAALALVSEELPGWDWGRRHGEMYLVQAYTEDNVSKLRGFDSGAPLLPASIQILIALLQAVQATGEAGDV